MPYINPTISMPAGLPGDSRSPAIFFAKKAAVSDESKTESVTNDNRLLAPTDFRLARLSFDQSYAIFQLAAPGSQTRLRSSLVKQIPPSSDSRRRYNLHYRVSHRECGYQTLGIKRFSSAEEDRLDMYVRFEEFTVNST